jgi:hypothetical protein
MTALDIFDILFTADAYKAGGYPLLRKNSSGVWVPETAAFARSSTGTRVNGSVLIASSAANIPRIDHFGGGCPALLSELSRANILTYSEQLNNAIWVKQSATVSANATTAPDGTTTADKLIETAVNDIHVAVQDVVISASSLTASAFLKQSEIRYAIMVISNAVDKNFAVFFDLQAGVVVGNFTSIGAYAAPTSSKIENYGNGWYRCSVTATNAFATPNLAIYLNRSGTDSGLSYLGDGTSGLFVWGAQMEAGLFNTSYNPTVATAVTRAIDTPDPIALTPTLTGTFMIDLRTCLSDLVGDVGISLRDGSGDQITIFYNGAANQNAVNSDGDTETNYASPGVVVISFGMAATKVFRNGVLINTLTAISAPVQSLNFVQVGQTRVTKFGFSYTQFSDAICAELSLI